MARASSFKSSVCVWDRQAAEYPCAAPRFLEARGSRHKPNLPACPYPGKSRNKTGGGGAHGRLDGVVRYCREDWWWVLSAASRAQSTWQAAGLDIMVLMVVRCVRAVEALIVVAAVLVGGVPASSGRRLGRLHSGRTTASNLFVLSVFPQRNPTNFRTIRETTDHNSLGRTTASDLSFLNRPPRIPPTRNTTNFRTIRETTDHNSLGRAGGGFIILAWSKCLNNEFTEDKQAVIYKMPTEHTPFQGVDQTLRLSRDATEPGVASQRVV
ncbi:hypothetical protein B0H16DRAFT_1695642 [Mycena metata]|uniref:Uncharacterized protein n=1 Tax=Mycena metata TaxID=1033252 RepID=A0AAD7I5F6_9AGAR|nr:hypothetical protein B0H16DRAFT_1695642 [Mycena metata]